MTITVKIYTNLKSDGSLLVSDLPIDKGCFKENCNYVRINHNDVRIFGMFHSCRAIPDVDRYRVRKNGNSICLYEHNSNEIYGSNYNDRGVSSGEYASSTIVLLLESPHKDEYTNDGYPIAPAQGATGDKIHKYLGTLLCHLSPHINDKDRIIIANPVQYQTSLDMILESNKLNKKVRDRIWNCLWKIESVKTDFLCRINKYRPNIIINACTGGRKKNSLRRTVSKFIAKKRLCVGRLYEIDHPYNWNIPEFHIPNCSSESLANSQGTETSSSITTDDTTDAPDDNSETAPASS